MAKIIEKIAEKKTERAAARTKTENAGATAVDKKLLVVIVNRGFAADVIENSRIEGATGATILEGRGGAGVGDTFLGMNITPEKEVVFILIDSNYADAAASRISETLGLTSAAGGISFMLPVNHMTRKLIEKDGDAKK